MYENGNALHKHWIVHLNQGNAYYIFRCDVCGKHFGLNPLKSSAKHLRSATQHLALRPPRSLKSEVGIGTFENALFYLGIKVLNCDDKKMQLNNDQVLYAIEHKGYVPSDAAGTGAARARAYDLKKPAILLPELQEERLIAQLTRGGDLSPIVASQVDSEPTLSEVENFRPNMEDVEPGEVRSEAAPMLRGLQQTDENLTEPYEDEEYRMAFARVAVRAQEVLARREELSARGETQFSSCRLSRSLKLFITNSKL